MNRRLIRLAHMWGPSVWPMADADDLIQAADVAIWQAAPDNDGLAYIVGRRAMVDAIRGIRGRRGSHRQAAEVLSLDWYTPDDLDTGMSEFRGQLPVHRSAEDEASGAAEAMRVLEGVAGLPGRKRDAATIFLTGETSDTVADRWGCSKHTVWLDRMKVRDALRVAA